MSWILVSVTAAGEEVDAVSDRLETLGANAVSIEAGDDEPILEPPPGAAPLWTMNRVTALFPHGEAPAALARRIDRELASLGLGPCHCSVLEDQDWTHAWRRCATARCFGNGLWVLPVDAPRPAGARTVIRLDPGLAFGTGAHPTTALCLEWVAGAALQGRTVIDLGCGSGVLAIAAAARGARHVHGVDHDPQALAATADNARANRVEDRITVSSSLPDASAHVVLANIVANTLIELAPRVAKACTCGASVVLSGILEDQVDAVWSAYAPALCAPSVRTRDGWAAIVATRTG